MVAEEIAVGQHWREKRNPWRVVAVIPDPHNVLMPVGSLFLWAETVEHRNPGCVGNRVQMMLTTLRDRWTLERPVAAPAPEGSETDG